jgi:hypothetical protein
MWWVLVYCGVVLTLAFVISANSRRSHSRGNRRSGRDKHGLFCGVGGCADGGVGAETFAEESGICAGNAIGNDGDGEWGGLGLPVWSGSRFPHPASLVSVMRKADSVDEIKRPLAASPPPARTLVASNRPSMSALVRSRNLEELNLAGDREATYISDDGVADDGVADDGVADDGVEYCHIKVARI